MAKIVRKAQKIFAGNAVNNGVFGSAQLGTKVLSNDLDDIQSLPAWDNGWNDATISADRLPTLEEMQGIQYVATTQLAYLFQEGIPEYDVDTTYFINSIVKKTGTYELYGSITDDNVGNALTDVGNWVFLQDLSVSGGPLNKFDATTAPTVNDDDGDGYSVGSRWVNVTTDLAYVCLDASTGAAVWKLTVLEDAGALTVLANDTLASAAPTAVAKSNFLPLGAISGFIPTSITGNSTTAAITVSAGRAVDSTGAALINKASTTAWAVSNGNAINGYQGGTTLPNNATIHVFACYGTSGVGFFAHTSLSPTIPAGYNSYFRRSFSFLTNGSGAPIPYTATEGAGGSMIAQLTDPTGQTTALSTTAATVTLTGIPTGYVVQPRARVTNGTSSVSTYWSSLSSTNTAVGLNGTAPGNTIISPGAQTPNTLSTILTNTSAQVRARADGSTSGFTYVDGWEDFRR